MKRIPFGKIQTILLVAVSIILIFTSVQLYQEKQKNDRQYQTFLNQFYFTVEATIESLDFILDEESLEEGDLKDALVNVDQNLEATELILDAGRRYVDHDIHSLDSIFRYHPIKQFAVNDQLLTAEEQYLKNLKSDLARIHQALQLDGTMQEDPDLNVDDFNDIVTSRGLDSNFLTMDKSLEVPFQIIDEDQVPDRIQKWLENNTSKEQRKVFRVDNKTYVVMISDDQTAITNMIKRGGGITVSYENLELHNESEQKTPSVIAELDGVGNQFFQFAGPSENDENTEEVEMKNNELHVQSSASIELIFVEELSKDGEIIDYEPRF